MSQVDSKVEAISGYIDTQYSGGDSNIMKLKQIYQEENNNDVDEITKDFSDMGCIVDTVTRPPNICIETCVYDDSDSDSDKKTENYDDNDKDEVHYSDEFEDDNSEAEEIKEVSKSENNSTSQIEPNKSVLKVSKSHSSVSSKPPSMSGRSGNSISYGSLSVPQTRRINMSFTNERLREIERHNHILLKKILSARNNKKSSIPPREQCLKLPVPPAAAAVHRKNKQRQIDHDNMILLKKIQRAKSSACSIRR